jgi:hypothetical protein
MALSPSLAKGGVGVGRFAMKELFGVATILNNYYDQYRSRYSKLFPVKLRNFSKSWYEITREAVLMQG